MNLDYFDNKNHSYSSEGLQSTGCRALSPEPSNGKPATMVPSDLNGVGGRVLRAAVVRVRQVRSRQLHQQPVGEAWVLHSGLDKKERTI